MAALYMEPLMALTATPHHFKVELSDVDRGVYEALDLRPARHPSETLRYLLTRTLAYCLAYEPGIAFSKGGLSSSDEPPLSVRDATGRLLVWVDVGAPSAERLHKAAKAAPRVLLFTHAELAALRREASSQHVHKLEAIEVYRFEPAFLQALEAHVERTTRLGLTRSEGVLYVSVGGEVFESAIERASLLGE
jgi:uncharacterized protein YaeQ